MSYNLILCGSHYINYKRLRFESSSKCCMQDLLKCFPFLLMHIFSQSLEFIFRVHKRPGKAKNTQTKKIKLEKKLN